MHSFSTRSGTMNQVDTTQVRKALRLNVTLEPIGMIQSRLPDLRDAGFIPQELDFASNLLLTDLEVVFDVLESACEKLHYLRRREQIEKNVAYLGDETDLLMFYLDTGFNLGNAEFDGTAFVLLPISKKLDPYFMREWHRLDAPKPRRNLTKWWRDILDYIEERRPSRWTEVGYMLLNMTDEDQAKFEKGFERVQKTVQKQWQKPGHANTVIVYSGSEQKRNLLVGLAYKNVTNEQRNAMMLEAGNCAMDDVKADQALIIGIDVHDPHYPYNVVAVVYKTNSSGD